MQEITLFSQLLGLCSPWKVVQLESDLDNKIVTIHIEWPREKELPCSECSKKCKIYDHRELRTWRHLDTMQFKTFLTCSVPRICCEDHGIKSIDVPWAERQSRHTILFERFAIDVLKAASSKSQAAKLLDLSWDEIHAIQTHAVQRGMARRTLDDTTQLGIDEKSFLKGQSYVSLLYDLDQSRVIDVVPDRTETASKLLLEAIPENNRDNISAFAVDMWAPYTMAINELYPWAAIVHDKYHVVSYLNKAVDTVRRQENKVLSRENDHALKGTKYTWLKNQENWSDKDRQTFYSLKDQNLKVGRAWSIKQTFMALWDYTYEKSARSFFRNWYFWATHSQLKPIIKVAKMINRHLENILTYVKHPITNSKAEGINSKIQSIKTAARGFRNFENYRTSILFSCGKLDLYP